MPQPEGTETMSTRLCNYCLLQDMKRLARRTHQVVTIRPHPLLPSFPEGVDVYIHHPSVPPPATRAGGTEPEATDLPTGWACWFAAVGERCAC